MTPAQRDENAAMHTMRYIFNTTRVVPEYFILEIAENVKWVLNSAARICINICK